MRITNQESMTKVWILMIELSRPMMDQSLPIASQLLLGLAGGLDTCCRMLLEWYYRSIIAACVTVPEDDD